MALHLSWYNAQQTAFRARYEPGWTWDQHHALIQDLSEMRTARGLQHILSLFDLRGTTLPIDAPARDHYQGPPEGSFVVLVIDNAFTRTVAQLVIRSHGHQHLMHLANTLEEGKALLDAQILRRSSLSV